MREKCGQIVVPPDSAPHHRYKAANGFVKPTCRKIRLVCIPPYTPQFNTTGIQWRVLKWMLASRRFGSTNDLVSTMTTSQFHV